MRKIDDALFKAIENGDVFSAECAIADGADVNARREDGNRPLHCVDSVDIANMLILRGANIDAKNKEDGMSPLHIAASRGMDDIVDVLINNDADVMVLNNYGETPLHLAANVSVAAMLLDAGADVNAMDDRGCSVLSVAADNEITDLLIQYGAVE